MIQNHILYFKIPIQFLVCWEGWTTRASGENRIFKPYPGCFGLSAKICIGNSTFQSTVLLKTVSVLAFSIISCIFCVLTKYIYLFLLSSLVSVLRLSQPVNMSVYTPVCLPPNGTDFTGRNMFPLKDIYNVAIKCCCFFNYYKTERLFCDRKNMFYDYLMYFKPKNAQGFGN